MFRSFCISIFVYIVLTGYSLYLQALDKMPGGRRTRTCNSLYARTTQEAEAEAEVEVSARSRPARRPRGRPRRAVQSSTVPPPEEDRTTTTDDEDQQLAP